MGRKRASHNKTKESVSKESLQQPKAGSSCDIADTVKCELDAITEEEDSQEVLLVKKKRKRSIPLTHDQPFRLDTLQKGKQFSRIKLPSESEESSISNVSVGKKRNPYAAAFLKAIASQEPKKSVELNHNKGTKDCFKSKIPKNKKHKCNGSADHSFANETCPKQKKPKETSSETQKELKVDISFKSLEKRKYELKKETFELEKQIVKTAPQLLPSLILDNIEVVKKKKRKESHHKTHKFISNKIIKNHTRKRFNINDFAKTSNTIESTNEFFGEEEKESGDFMILRRYSKLYNCSFDPIVCLDKISNKFETNELLLSNHNDWIDYEDEIDIKYEPLLNDTVSDQYELYSDTLRGKYEGDADILLAPIKKESISPTEVYARTRTSLTKQNLTQSLKILNRDFNYDNYQINRYNKCKSKYLYVPNTTIKRLTSHDTIFRNATLATMETFNLLFSSAIATNFNEQLHTRSSNGSNYSSELDNTSPYVLETMKNKVKLSIKKIPDTGEWTSEFKQYRSTKITDVETPITNDNTSASTNYTQNKNKSLETSDTTETIDDSSINHPVTVLKQTESPNQIVTVSEQLRDAKAIPINIKDNKHMNAPNTFENGIDNANCKYPNSTDLHIPTNTKQTSIKRFNYTKWSKKINAIVDVVTQAYSQSNGTELIKPIFAKTDSRFAVPVAKDCQENDVKLGRVKPRSESRFKRDSVENHAESSKKVETSKKVESSKTVESSKKVESSVRARTHSNSKSIVTTNQNDSSESTKVSKRCKKLSKGDKKPITLNEFTEPPKLCATFNESSVALSAIKISKRKYMESPQSMTRSITPIPSESSFTLSPKKIGISPRIKLDFDSKHNYAMPQHNIKTTERRDSDITMDSKRKHTFKFDSSGVKRPPTRKPILLNRPTTPIIEFKVPSPVISLSSPSKHFTPMCKPDDFDVISIYADTIANKSVCDNKSVILSLSDEEDVNESSESFENITFNKSNPDNIGIDVGSWVAQSLKVQTQRETTGYSTKIEVTPVPAAPVTTSDSGKIVAGQSVNEARMNEPRLPVKPPNIELYQFNKNSTAVRPMNETNISKAVVKTPPPISSIARNIKNIIPTD